MSRRTRGWIFKRGETWYIGYFAPGAISHAGVALTKCQDVLSGRATQCLSHTGKVRKAAGPRRSDAVALLERQLADLDAGKWTSPTKPLILDELFALLRADWRARGRKSTLTAKRGKDVSSVRRLREAFGSGEVRNITAARLAKYANHRLDAGASISTVRNDLNLLKHGMAGAVKQGQLAVRPAFPSLVPTNIRTGFFERGEFEALLAELPEAMRAPVTFMYWTGWRSKSEVLTRQWRHVDLASGVIRLEPGETKNGKAREFPYRLVPELAAAIDAQRAYTDAVQRQTGQVVPWVFHRKGRRFGRAFYYTWKAACARVGIAGRIPHDFRRTAARNLVERAGVSEKVAMELTGHLTRSVFERYHITNASDRERAVSKLAAIAPDRAILPLLDPKRTQKAAAQ